MSNRCGTVLVRVFAVLACIVFPGITRAHGETGQRATNVPAVIEEVSFRHGPHTLSGNLFRPPGDGPFPAVVLILGSDRHDRNYGGVATALGHHFARSGVACLTWDKPGVGKSTGDYLKQTLSDRALEALAAVHFLQNRQEIGHDRIGVWGHSQGGTVAPLTASLSPDVAFLIEVSGWQGPVWKQDAVRVGAELRAAGFGEADVEQAVAFARKRMDMIRGNGPYEELEKAQNTVKALPWFRSVHFCDRALFESVRPIVNLDTSSWWSKVRCPVLVFYGDRDLSTGPPEPVVAVIRDGLRAAGNTDVTVRIMRGADHGIIRANATGKPDHSSAKAKSSRAEPDFAAGYLETMTDWIAKKVR
jgi:uncharacterized protein